MNVNTIASINAQLRGEVSKEGKRTLEGYSHHRLMAGKILHFPLNGFGTARRLERPTEQLWNLNLGQMLCDANRLSYSCQRKFNEFCFFFYCFVYRLVSIQGFGRETPAPQRSMEARYTLTLANHSHLCPHLPSTCIDLVPSNHVTDVNSSILCKQKTKIKKKNTITDCYFSSSPLIQLSQARVSMEIMENWVKLRKKTEQVQTDTCDTELHWALGEP